MLLGASFDLSSNHVTGGFTLIYQPHNTDTSHSPSARGQSLAQPGPDVEADLNRDGDDLPVVMLIVRTMRDAVRNMPEASARDDNKPVA